MIAADSVVVGDDAAEVDHGLRSDRLDGPELLGEPGRVAVGAQGEGRRRAVGDEVGEAHGAGAFAAGRFANG